MLLDLPLSVGPEKICVFFSAPEGGKWLCFCCVFCPYSKEENSGLHSARVNYSSFYVIFLLQYWRSRRGQ